MLLFKWCLWFVKKYTDFWMNWNISCIVFVCCRHLVAPRRWLCQRDCTFMVELVRDWFRIDKIQDNFMNPLQKLHGLPEMYMKHYTSQQHMFSFIGITVHSQKQLPLIHSQTRLHFIPALSSPHPHLYSCCVMCLSACLLVVCPNGYWNDMYIYMSSVE